jgi:hypothetical protein
MKSDTIHRFECLAGGRRIRIASDQQRMLKGGKALNMKKDFIANL